MTSPHHNRSRSWNVFQFPPQLLQDVVEVGEGDGAADVQHDRVLLAFGALKVLQLAEDGCVLNASDLSGEEQKTFLTSTLTKS